VVRDLEDLTNSVRDPNSRRHFREAVRAYQGGALRSAIVSTWVAVALDIVSKIRELAAGGEPAAVAFIDRLDEVISRDARDRAMALERELLDAARDSFELLTAREHEELARLRNDRHICAHPAFVSLDVVFEPTQELVRAHLSTAVDCLLAHPTTPGKKAIQRFYQEAMSSSAFPEALEDLTEYLRARYFQHGKASLRRNLARVIIKTCLAPEGNNLPLARRCSHSAQALERIEPGLLHDALVEVVQRREEGPGLTDEELVMMVGTLGSLSATWDAFPDSSRPRVAAHLAAAPLDELVDAGVFAADVEGEPIASAISSRLNELNGTQLGRVLAQHPQPKYQDAAVAVLASSRSYRSAESNMENLILPLAHRMHGDTVRKVLGILLDNDQVRNAAAMPDLMERFFVASKGVIGSTWLDWSDICEKLAELTEGPDEYYSYPGLRARVEAELPF